MPPIVATTVVNRPAEVVFAYATDPAHFHEWRKGVTTGHMDSAGSPMVGVTCPQFLGQWVKLIH